MTQIDSQTPDSAGPRGGADPATLRAAWAFGVAGLIPFVGAPAFCHVHPLATGPMLGLQLAYGALILSFLGGTRFGRALGPGAPGGARGAITIAVSMVPTLWGLGALAAPLVMRDKLLAMAAGLVLTWAWDYASPGWPSGYRGLRSALTATAVASLVWGAGLAAQAGL